MTDEQRLQAFAQKVYLTKNGRYFDDIEEEDGIEFVNQTIDWVNMFLDEYELEADWQEVRDRSKEIGTIASTGQTFTLPAGVRKLSVNEHEPLSLHILQDGTPVSEWEVVSADLITDPTNTSTADRVTTVGNKIIFSRPLTEGELSGTVRADVINSFPRLSRTNTSVFDLIKPEKLMVLGVAKDATLPDVVQGGISPALASKYDDLLQKKILENNATSASANIQRDDYGYIGGVGF